MRKNQLKKINKLLSKFKHLDKYKDMSFPLKTVAEFRKIPISNKEELKNFNTLYCSVSPFNITATSGTTDLRLIILHSDNCYQVHLRRVAETYKSIGINKGDLCLNTCSYSLNSGGRIMESAFKYLGVGVIPFGSFCSQKELSRLVDLIKRFKPNIINAYTNQLYDIFSMLQHNHNIKKCIVNGEPLFDSYKKNMEAFSGAKIYNNYGSMEFSGFAICEYPNDEYMKLFEDGLYIEVLKNDNSISEKGTGKIVVTDLENTCMPFIRYIVGDEVEIIKNKKEKYLKVLGRSQNSILINGVIFDKIEIVQSIQKTINHPRFFIMVNKNSSTYMDELLVNIPFSDKDKIDILRINIEKEINLDCMVKFRLHSGNLPKTSSGKYRHIIDVRKDAK